MARALPNLQDISLCKHEDGGYYAGRTTSRMWYPCFRDDHKYADGISPDETEAARTADYTTHDIEIVSRFRNLRSLQIEYEAPLNGTYPFLFNFPLLQNLYVSNCHHLKFNLDMLAGFPLLKELSLWNNTSLSGNIESLRLFKDTLEKVEITLCAKIVGDFMLFADFPHLKWLDLISTPTTGDVRDIRNYHFPMLENFHLSDNVYGGTFYKFQHLSDVPAVMRALHHLVKRQPDMFQDHSWELAEESPDWYREIDWRGTYPGPPLYVCFDHAGPRVGWRWWDKYGNECEVNWLDPEPERGSSDFEIYKEDLECLDYDMYNSYFSGYYLPPTENEYKQMCSELRDDVEGEPYPDVAHC